MWMSFPFPPKIEACVSLAELNTEDVSWEQSGGDQHRPGWTATERSRPEQCKADQQGAEHNCPRGDGPATPPSVPPLWGEGGAASQSCCLHSCAISLLSCFALNTVSFFTAPQIRDICWYWIGANKHQLILSISSTHCPNYYCKRLSLAGLGTLGLFSICPSFRPQQYLHDGGKVGLKMFINFYDQLLTYFCHTLYIKQILSIFTIWLKLQQLPIAISTKI